MQRDAALNPSSRFGAKLRIHHSELEPTLQRFAPTAQQLQWATNILAASASGSGAQRLQGQMVDRPVIERARQALQRHQSLHPEAAT